MTLSELIAARVARKQGDKEFRLAYMPELSKDQRWEAEIGNSSRWVCLGEAQGEFWAYDEAPEGAVRQLLTKLEAQ